MSKERLLEIPMHDGIFFVTDRNTSYHNPEFGPNCEDRYSMFFELNGEIYNIGSHPSLKGAQGWGTHRVSNRNYLYDALYYTDLRFRSIVAKAKGES